jgi:Bacterial regulatory proteins, lacI family
MPTLLDDELERHEGPEPRVITEDIQALLRVYIRPGDDDSGASVASVAEHAGVSTRTVYRVLQGTTETVSLDLADNLCLACSSHMAVVDPRLKFPDGERRYSDW